MGRRSKEKTELIYVGSKEKILKELENSKQQIEQIQEAQREQAERWINSPQSDYEKMLYRRIQDIQAAASEMGVDFWSVAWALDPLKYIQTKTVAPMDFQSSLTDEHIKSLLPIMNEFVFTEALSVDDVSSILKCVHTTPVRVKSNALLSYLFGELSRNKWICQNWQKVAEINKCFLGSRGSVLTQKALSSAPTKYCAARGIVANGMRDYPILSPAIHDAVMRLKR